MVLVSWHSDDYCEGSFNFRLAAFKHSVLIIFGPPCSYAANSLGWIE